MEDSLTTAAADMWTFELEVEQEVLEAERFVDTSPAPEQHLTEVGR